MVLDRADYNNQMENLQSKCKKYLYYNVTLIMSDGSIFDGIIENVEQDRICLLIGEDVIELDDDEYTSNQNRQYNRGPRRRFRRFRRRFIPFSNVVALELLPFIPPYPYLFY